jgi:predicted phosphodiesterase
MIYLISDLHGGEKISGLKDYIANYIDGDLLIILGDVGIKFEDTLENQKFTEYFLSIDKPIAFIEGNHENHAYLNSFPEEEWCGGKINRISKNIVRLKRGNVYQILGKTFFTMGGCKSSAKWKEMGLWHDGEEPTREELALAYENLKAHGNKVDYVLTHKYYPDMASDDPLTLEGLKEYIDSNVDFKRWYSGHWHRETTFSDRHIVVYENLKELE